VYFIAGEVTQPQIRVIMGRLTKLAAIVWKMNTLAPEVNATKLVWKVKVLKHFHQVLV